MTSANQFVKPVKIRGIFVIHSIVIIKSKIWIISHCLGLGHETMVCTLQMLYILLQLHKAPNAVHKYSHAALKAYFEWSEL